MIVKWMHMFGSYRVYSTDYNKLQKILQSLEYEMRDSKNLDNVKESSAEFFNYKSKSLAYAIQRLVANDDDFVCMFYGLVINRRNVVKKFDGDVDSGYSDQRQVNTNPQNHDIRHCEVIYRKQNAVKGVLLVSPPKDYIHRKRVLSLQGIIKKYAIRHGLKIYTGGEEIIAASYD